MLHEPRDLALIGRVEELLQALPPGDREHRRVSRRAQRPAHPVRQEQRKIARRHHDHRGHQHGHGGKDAAQDEEAPPPPREGLKFLQNDGIEMVAHGMGLAGRKAGDGR